MNPVILYDNRFNDGVITATDTATGYDVQNIKDLRPYTFWQAASFGTKYLTVDCVTSKQVDTLAIIGHNFFTSSALISVESSPDNAIWTQRLAPFTPPSDKAFMSVFSVFSARFWRIKIVTAAIVPRVAVAMLGAQLLMPFPADSPYTPWSGSVKADNLGSKTGNLLGCVVRYRPFQLSPQWSNIDRTFVFGAYKTFWDIYASTGKPFFYGWDLTAYPTHVLYARIIKDAAFDPPLSIGSFVDAISLKMEGALE